MSQCLPKVEVFSCSYNSIFEYTENAAWLLNLHNIRVLDMSWQKDTTKPYDMMSQVSNITDSLTNFSISMAPSLEFLDISHSHLPPIPAITLVTPVNLRILRAVNAGISNLTKPIYCQYTPRIHEIDVTNNNINHINQDVFAKCNWTSVAKLRMGGNLLGDLGMKPFFRPFSGLVVRTLTTPSHLWYKLHQIPKHKWFLFYQIHWSQVLSREWRCRWSSTDRRCSNYIWVINNFSTYSCAPHIRGLTIF